ncbi:ABC transporter permease [Corynebacterium crudilactis]|uniref:ABC transporter permease n=1 Tax=Corynebacterium crudilactis TaxID=1652495 RepID=UPI001FE0BA3E|nr:ABC transporter permease [Corynebacterium crudilactis]
MDGHSLILGVFWSAVLVLSGSLLVEKFLPLLSISKLEWIYQVRPTGQVKFNAREPIAQIVAFSLFGMVLGAAHGQMWLWLIISCLVRLATGLAKKRSLPSLLTAGEKKILSAASLSVLDSGLVADATTITHLRWKEQAPTANYLVLAGRRFFRRPHIALMMLVIISFTFSFSGIFGAYSASIFLLLWSVVGADVARCADFSKLHAPGHYKAVVLLFHAVPAIGIVLLITDPAHVLVHSLLIVVSVVWAGIARSRPRRVDQITYIDSGIAGPVSPEIIRFYLAGLPPALFASLLLLYFSV